jgi:hypothetical protein
LWIWADHICTFWSSFAGGLSGSVRTAERRERMLSRIKATAECMRAPAQREKWGSVEIKGLLRAS